MVCRMRLVYSIFHWAVLGGIVVSLIAYLQVIDNMIWANSNRELDNLENPSTKR